MAITDHNNHRSVNDGKVEMSVDEFKKWLKNFDANRDGRINVEELRQAIRANGGWFCGLKAKRGMKMADKNFNGAIDDTEISNLVQFAEKHLGLRIIPTY